MTTFAGWLADQRERQDAVGNIARLWTEISPGRTHSVQGVTKALLEHAEANTATWVPEALAATAEEYRAWKVNPEGASVSSPATRSQLDRIEGMLAKLLDSLGIPLADLELAAKDGIAAVPDGVVIPISPEQRTSLTEQAGVMVPYIKAEGGLGMRPAGAPSAVHEETPDETADPDEGIIWNALYRVAAHDLPEDAELGEQAE